MKCKVRRHVAASKGPVARRRGQPPQFHPMQQSVGARQAAIAIKLLFQDALGIDLRSLHAAGTPGHAPGGCAGRCMPGQSARQYEGQGPMDCAAFTGTPGGMPMAFVRCYTGTDGQSHFEDLDLLPPDMERSIERAASSITFTRSPNGRFSDWHNAPRRQYAIFLSGGEMEVVIADGTTRRFGAGDAVLFEDLTGQGHTSRSVGGDRLTAIVPLADWPSGAPDC